MMELNEADCEGSGRDGDDSGPIGGGATSSSSSCACAGAGFNICSSVICRPFASGFAAGAGFGFDFAPDRFGFGFALASSDSDSVNKSLVDDCTFGESDPAFLRDFVGAGDSSFGGTSPIARSTAATTLVARPRRFIGMNKKDISGGTVTPPRGLAGVPRSSTLAPASIPLRRSSSNCDLNGSSTSTEQIRVSPCSARATIIARSQCPFHHFGSEITLSECKTGANHTQ
jgi:hypothetical protein